MACEITIPFLQYMHGQLVFGFLINLFTELTVHAYIVYSPETPVINGLLKQYNSLFTVYGSLMRIKSFGNTRFGVQYAIVRLATLLNSCQEVNFCCWFDHISMKIFHASLHQYIYF